MKQANPPHPGEIIQAEIMEPLRLSTDEAAERFGVPSDSLAAVLDGSAPVSQTLADSLERLGYSTSRFWMTL